MHDDIDLTDLDRFTTGFPHHVFDVLRRESPAWFHPPTAHTPGAEGFWVLSRYADIIAAATDSDTFSSETGGDREGGGTTLEDMPSGFAVGVLLNMMDDPRHAKIRKLLTPSTTPRALRAIEEDLRRRAVGIVDAAIAKRECDFLVDVAAELPLQAVAQLAGVPQEDRHELMNWANVTLDYEDREVGEINDRVTQAQAQMFTYGTNLLERKRTRPADDLLSVVTHALIDGEPLTENEQRMFLSLIIAAGSETTRNSIALGMSALSEHPEAWERLRGERALLPTAVEEMLRWASSTPYNRRTATRDVELHGPAHRRRRQGKPVVGVGQPRPDRVRGSLHLRHHPKPESALDLRPRRALLPGRITRPDGDAGDLRCAARPRRRGHPDRTDRVRPQQQTCRSATHARHDRRSLKEST